MILATPYFERQRSFFEQFNWMAFLNLQATCSRSFVDPPRSLTPPKIHSRDLTCKAWITSRKMAVPWRRCKSFQDYLEKKLPDVVKLCRVTPCQFPRSFGSFRWSWNDQSRYTLVDLLKTRQRRQKWINRLREINCRNFRNFRFISVRDYTAVETNYGIALSISTRWKKYSILGREAGWGKVVKANCDQTH